MIAVKDISSIDIDKVIEHIASLNRGLKEFWSSAKGWAPIEAAQLLTKSRLDWQVSLSHSLRLWFSPSPDNEKDARLILAWTNLGSLVEGTLKFFLSVWYESYKTSAASLTRRNGKRIDPDELQLEQLRVFFKKEVWTNDDRWDAWILIIQKRRNAIHAYKDRELGTLKEFEDMVRTYFLFLSNINERLPYPDEDYMPRESLQSW
ncbi:MAG: hypothetical protein O6943_07460 [Bacteroidetes bacterium]|nr:hypothetical protein [Bacteroidota bacterium]